ncbi:hypothetical protein ABZ929_09250 [Streptomyces physcomitrii]|uniref:hypothetical protein n=1 Tax=Streptomyces physcomitrii TaxID=2724184 RepID=UPI0034102C16
MDERTHPVPPEPRPEDPSAQPPRPPAAPLPPPAQPPAARGPRPSTPLDRLLIALGNASLLGLGYLLLARRGLALGAAAGSLVLVCLTASVARPWCEVLLLGWWAAGLAHGWWLAGRTTGRMPGRGPQLAVLGLALVVLLGAGLLRHDAHRIDRSADRARERGDCAGVLAAEERVWSVHRLADAPLTARGDELAHACEELEKARTSLTKGLTGDTDALDTGFRRLASVLGEPGQGRTVETVLDGFLDGLPTEEPCRTVTVTDWLRERGQARGPLGRSAGTAARTAPAALLRCGDALMADDHWKTARERYEQLLSQYPGDKRTGEARERSRKATLAIELAHVRSLLADSSTDVQPTYCTEPAKYSGAPAYRKGANRALLYGNDEYTGRIAAKWRVEDPAKAALVVCVDEEAEGPPVRTCPYESKLALGGSRDVTFHKIAVPAKVYELRTGKLVARRKLQISGESCPQVLKYETFLPRSADIGPPPDVNVEASKGQVRAAMMTLITR